MNFGFGHLSIPEKPVKNWYIDKHHHKCAVIDNHKVIMGSFNWCHSEVPTNEETILVINSPKLATHFVREMDHLWESAELGITPHLQRKLDRKTMR